MNKPVHKAETVREIPHYIRLRYRLVKELIVAANVEKAKKAKAQMVFDISTLL